MKHLAKVAVIGRANVGKSRIFNRLIRKRKAIVDDQPGVTRDRVSAICTYDEGQFELIDTGGLETTSENPFESAVNAQALYAARLADIILFVVDGRSGLQPEDQAWGQELRKLNTHVMVIVNKIDSNEREDLVWEFFQLGLNPIFGVSAEHARGFEPLLTHLFEHLPTRQSATYENQVDVAIVGRPNVGKSSIINCLTHENRVIASPVSGTTRDAIDIFLNYDNHRFRLVDTAGIRQKAAIKTRIEKYALTRSLGAIDEADIAIMVVDATESITEQDTKIIGYAIEQGKAIILAVNKWDLITEKDSHASAKYLQDIRDRLKFLPKIPILLISAHENKRVNKLLPTVLKVYEEYQTELPTGELNTCLQNMIQRHPPAVIKHQSKIVKFYFVTQVSNKPPKLIIFTNSEANIHFSYKRYLINQFRRKFDLNAVPLQIAFKSHEKMQRFQ